MARIAGATSGIDAAFAAALTRFTGKAQDVNSAQTVFRWIGEGEGALAAKHDAIAVVDGRFYNREEFGVADAPIAEQLIELYRRHGFAQALSRINGDFAAAL